MSDEIPSYLDKFGEDIRSPAERDPERYARAKATADALIARIEAAVKSVGPVRASLDKGRVNQILDAVKWHLPQRILELLKIDEKLENLHANKRAIVRGQVVEGPDGPIVNKADRERAVNFIETEEEFLEGARTWILAAMSGSVRIWDWTERDQDRLDTTAQLLLVTLSLSQIGASFLNLKLYRILADGTEVPVELPALPPFK